MKPLQSSADHKRREAAQSRAVKQRDKKDGRPCCRMERRYHAIGGGFVWRECGKSGQLDTVHILRRNQCGKVWDSPDVALAGCRECHSEYDRNILGESKITVRVPYDRAKAAWDLVLANTKVPPPAHYNPDHNDRYSDVERAA